MFHPELLWQMSSISFGHFVVLTMGTTFEQLRLLRFVIHININQIKQKRRCLCKLMQLNQS